MSISTSQVWAIIGLAALIWLALSIVGVASGGGISIVFNLADIIPALLFGWWLYERWGWRWGPLHAVGLLSTPVVIGTWRGTLESFWKDPKTGELPAPKTVYLTIAQTVTSVSVRLLTDESSSEQVAGAITRAESGFPAISYNYRNKPQLELRQTRSPIHYGAAVIEIEGRPATGRPQLIGQVHLPRARTARGPDFRAGNHARVWRAAAGWHSRRPASQIVRGAPRRSRPRTSGSGPRWAATCAETGDGSRGGVSPAGLLECAWRGVSSRELLRRAGAGRVLNPRGSTSSETLLPRPARSREWLNVDIIECQRCHQVVERRAPVQRHCPDCRKTLKRLRSQVAVARSRGGVRRA